MVVEKSRTISEVAKSYGLVPQTVGNWVNKWRKTHSGTESEEMTAAQLAEYKKIKAAHPNRGCRSWGLKPPVSSRLRAM